MSIYTITLFFHVLGAISLFIVTGIVFASLLYLRRAKTVEQAREWISLPNAVGRLVPVFEIVMLVTGLYLVSLAWWTVRPTWALVSLATLVFLIPFGLLTVGRHLQNIFNTIKDLPDGPLPDNLAEQIGNLTLLTSHCIFLTLLIGIVFLMTVKLALVGSLITIVTAIVLGVVLSIPLRRDPQVQGGSQVA